MVLTALFTAVSSFVPSLIFAQVPEFDPRPVLTIGVADGPAAQAMGHISSIAVDHAGNIFILDNLSHEIRWFNAQGEYRTTGGRSGGGPGEMRSPRAIAVDDSGRVHLVDPGNLRITTFLPTDSGLVVLRDARTVFALNLCILGQRRFILARHDDRMVHEIAEDGTILRSFGELEPPDPAIVRQVPRMAPTLQGSANRAQMLCDGESRSIVLLHHEVPIVRSFDLNGRLRWRTVLSQYRRLRYVPVAAEGGGQGIRGEADPETGTFHLGRGVVRTRDGHLMATLLESGLRRDSRYEVRILRFTDGQVLAKESTRIPIILMHGNLGFVIQDQPFPRVLAYRSVER